MATWNPWDAPENRILFTHGKQSILSPGLCQVFGLNRERQWDEVRTYAGEGANLRYMGRKLSHFNVVFSLYTPEHWADWLRLQPMLLRAPIGPQALEQAADTVPPPVSAIGVQHSLINSFGVSAVVVESVNSPEPSGDTGAWVVTVNLIEHHPLAANQAVNVSGADATPADAKEERNAALDKVNERLRQKANVDQLGRDAGG